MIPFALLFVFGAWSVQQMAQLPSFTWLLCAIVVLALLFSIQIHPRFLASATNTSSRVYRFLIFTIGSFLLGIFWASGIAQWRMSDELPRAWEQKTIEVVGVVSSVPEITERGERFRFDVEKILTPEAVVPRHISLNQYGEYGASQQHYAALFHAGERWQLSVRLKRPHGTANPHGFDFEAWALAEGIRATGSIKGKASHKRLAAFVWQPKYVVERIREQVKYRIGEVLKDKPYSGIIQALVMGDDSQILQDDWQVFLRTGTSHLMSISGLHITMLSGLVFGLVCFCWRRVPVLVMRLPTRKAATIAGVVVALLYALVAGFSVPTQRTLYMLMVFAVVLWSGRQFAISQVLVIALFVVVLIDPWAVIAPGFWLSFGAVAMLAYALGARIGQQNWLIAVLKTQWAVTIGMLPLLLVMFNQASIISPIANAFAIPLISFVVTPLALLGSFLPVDMPLNFSYQVLAGCMWALKWLSQLPIATWQQHAPPVWTLLPATLGMLWLLLPRGFPMRWLGLLGLLPMFLVVPARPMPGDMKVTVLDVGQGLSVTVQTATHTLLYDSGAKYSEQSDAGGRIVVPYLRGEGVRKIDGFVVSHDDIDHSGGMQSVLAQLPVTWLVSSFNSKLEIPAIPPTTHCYAGQAWTWDAVRFEVLHPSIESYSDVTIKDNNRSCVIKITSQVGSILLTGDIEKESELGLLQTNAASLKSDVVVVPHHGSKTSSTLDFVVAVEPGISLFTMGYLNRFKHPKPAIVERYQAVGSLIYRSDYHGALELIFEANAKNNHQIRVASWRQQNQRYWQDMFVE
jgi:competence protein ComEC